MNASQPISVKWFQERLDKLRRGRSIDLRVAWAPSLHTTRFIPINGRLVQRDYAKYPLVGKLTERDYVRGHRFYRIVDGKPLQVGYQKVNGLVEGNVKPDDWVEPDYEHLNPSIQIFVVEVKRPDEYARKVHERKRYLSQVNQGVDLFGDFPTEGVWDWWADISEHREQCCEMAQIVRVDCRGLYRPPDERDLQDVERALRVHESRAANDLQSRVEQAERDIRGAIQTAQDKFDEELKQEAFEIERIAIRSITKPAVYLDSSKQFKSKGA